MIVSKTSKPHELVNLNERGSYQWWYFDGISNQSDYSFVVILFSSFPFSPRYLRKIYNGNEKLNTLDFAAVNFNLYKNGKQVNYFLQEFKSDAISIVNKNDELCTLKIGNNSIQFDAENKIELRIKGIEKWTRRVIDAAFDIKFEQPTGLMNGEENTFSNCKHTWIPAGIKMSFNSKFKIRRSEDQFAPRKKLIFDGEGYYDRNIGTEPMSENILDWKWGRFRHEDLTLVFFDIEYKDEPKKFKKLIITKNNEVIINSDSPKFNYDNSKNYWMLEYPKNISIDDKDVSVNINNETKLDNGPFYIRFKPDFEVNLNGDIIRGKGISEVIKPQSLLRTWLYPFINMRIHKEY